MRFHRNYEQLQLWSNAQDLAEMVRADRLVAARLEPVIRQGLGHTVLDLVFGEGGRYLTVPAIIVDSPQIILREQDRLVWPEPAARAIEDARAIEIESSLFPWLRTLTMGRCLNDETIRHFGDARDRDAFEFARAARYTGAALLEESVKALSPYVYGARFTRDKNVLVSGAADGVQGAAFLARQARSVRTEGLDEAEEAFGLKWFPALSRPAESATVEVAFANEPLGRSAVEIIVDAVSERPDERRIAAAAYPMDILFTNETLHGPEVRNFGVRAPAVSTGGRAQAIAPYVPVGGSAGRILFGMRRDWETARDADVDSALCLAALLRSEGFTVDLCGEPDACEPASYDVVHCFNLVELQALPFLMKARAAAVRTVLTATFVDVAGDRRQWGVETHPVCFRQEIDDASLAMYLSFVERRALLAPGWEDAGRRGPVQNYDAHVSQLLGYCDSVIAESQEEAALLRRFGFEGEVRVIPPFLAPGRGPEHARLPVAGERFALIHAPIEPRNNQLFAVRAAREAGIPLVLAGFVRDMEYAARIREAADESVTMLDPDDAELHWLYGHASVILDCAWYGFGTARLARAVLSGAAVCASTAGWGPVLWPGMVSAVDPASVRALAKTIGEAVPAGAEARAALAHALDPAGLLRNTLEAYVGTPPPQAGA